MSSLPERPGRGLTERSSPVSATNRAGYCVRRLSSVRARSAAFSISSDWLKPAGLPHIRDAAGYNLPRAYLPTNELPRDFDAAVVAIGAWLTERLTALESVEKLRGASLGGRSARDARTS